MATKAHKLLTGTDLHESKGVATALAGQVYVTDGAGSGVWTTINTGIQFSTGDVKFTYKTSADAGWLIPTDGQSIGSTSSGASYADTTLYAALYTLLWNGVSNTYAPVAGGRGGSAAADFAANKKLTFPTAMSRAIGIAGAGTGLTARTLGQFMGAETVTIAQSGLPNVTVGITGNTSAVSLPSDTAHAPNGYVATNFSSGGGGTVYFLGGGTTPTQGGNTGTGTITSGSTASLNGGITQTTTAVMQPTLFLNLMIKY